MRNAKLSPRYCLFPDHDFRRGPSLSRRVAAIQEHVRARRPGWRRVPVRVPPNTIT